MCRIIFFIIILLVFPLNGDLIIGGMTSNFKWANAGHVCRDSNMTECYNLICDTLEYRYGNATYAVVQRFGSDFKDLDHDLPVTMIVFGVNSKFDFFNGTIKTCYSYNKCMEWARNVWQNTLFPLIMITGDC